MIFEYADFKAFDEKSILADTRSYFNTVRRNAEADKKAMRIRKLLGMGENNQ